MSARRRREKNKRAEIAEAHFEAVRGALALSIFWKSVDTRRVIDGLFSLLLFKDIGRPNEKGLRLLDDSASDTSSSPAGRRRTTQRKMLISRANVKLICTFSVGAP